MTAILPSWPLGSPRPAAGHRALSQRGGKVPGPVSPPTRPGPGTAPLRVTTTCLAGCGWTATGLTSDPPTGPKPRGWKHGMGVKWTGGELPWTRWAELDHAATHHEHPADLVAVPA